MHVRADAAAYMQYLCGTSEETKRVKDDTDVGGVTKTTTIATLHQYSTVLYGIGPIAR